MWRALNNDEFPIVHPHGNLIGFGKLPIKVGMALLCLVVAQERRGDGETIEKVGG